VRAREAHLYPCMRGKVCLADKGCMHICLNLLHKLPCNLELEAFNVPLLQLQYAWW